MGCCLSKSKGKNQGEGHKKRTKNKADQSFDCFENERQDSARNSAMTGKKSRSKRYSSSTDESSSDTSGSESGHRKPKVSSSKKMKRRKNGGITMVSTKTVIGGDNITIGEGSKIVNVTIGGRNDRRSKEQTKRRKSSDPNLLRPNFSKLKPRHENGAFQLPACFMQLTDGCRDVADLEVLVKAANSVGKIHASDNFCATVFRVGPNYIMTCKHVLDGILHKETNHVGDFACREGPSRFDVLKKNSVYVDFNYKYRPNAQSNDTEMRNAIFYLTSNVKFQDQELDVAILELKENESTGIQFPDAFINFSHASPNKKFTFIGHPDGNVKKQNEVDGPYYLDNEMYAKAVDWSMRENGSNGFEGANMPERLLFHCSFQQGGSGSPGLAVEGGKKAVVVTMLLRGYPEWYYAPDCNPQIRARVSPDQCIEQGVDMVSLYHKMHRINRDLCNSIFGQNA